MTEAAKIEVDRIIAHLKKGKDIHEIFANTVRTGILIQGKTLEEWRAYFELKIPDDTGVGQCKELDSKLVAFHQEATFLKSMAEATLTLGRKGYNSQYREKFAALVSEYKSFDKKLPAKETLEVLASTTLDELEASLTYAELAVKFWKDVLEDLNFKRKALENITINNSVQAKLDLGFGASTQNRG